MLYKKGVKHSANYQSTLQKWNQDNKKLTQIGGALVMPDYEGKLLNHKKTEKIKPQKELS